MWVCRSSSELIAIGTASRDLAYGRKKRTMLNCVACQNRILFWTSCSLGFICFS